ncbi:MAG: hypothetical protein DWQ51_06320 [Microcystis wesenbergii TW10]|uniref:Uncharacterized protein n=5 Tax=Microcystis TaxID=1125 RepID=A0A0A1VTZ9_MICAE|nr:MULTISPECIES: hypothetical protein [Microcystis]REJ54554.1 MAG: hypothetical protein DWQ51_06320 [Microcystis wesenbergii TW10]TRT87943.1 MAG: hypothetical protein EWV63_07260 [Microcystis aeruginosa Ma_OC_H_19870700_S124]MBD2116743.1 hypothetical protein [Microcystis wesenbergii FACHB-1339]MCZ8040533.1 hypothetical protein [Microcystis sp. LE17-20A]MCZ8213577.1 hypothetical protein [Microcystis sp. LE19-8.1F]
MTHTFLLEPGRWKLEGSWLERDKMPIPIKGRLLIAWSQDNWFSLVSKLIFPDGEKEDISFQYRGRLGTGKREYTFVLQQSILGQIEGEGWIGADTIIQRHWVLTDSRRGGFETFYRINNNSYHLASGILNRHYLISTMEAILERQL